MWLKRSTDFLLKHPVMAFGIVFAITFVPVIGMLGILIATLVTLQKSAVEGAVLTVAASLPYATGFLIAGNPQPDVPCMVWMAMGFAISGNILTWVFAMMLRRHASWSSMLQFAALLGILVISVVHLVYPSITDWWGGQLQSYYDHVKPVTNALTTSAVGKVSAATGVIAEAGTHDIQVEAINIAKQYATGIMAVFILLVAILQLLAARICQSVWYGIGSVRKELLTIRLSRLAGILFSVGLVLSYMGNTVVLDVMPVAYVLFCVAGLSVSHYILRQATLGAPTAWLWLVVFYSTLILILGVPVSILVMSILALLDIGLDLRKRLRKI